eukprot:5801818-Pleurochrysis_carterae.AAC.1
MQSWVTEGCAASPAHSAHDSTCGPALPPFRRHILDYGGVRHPGLLHGSTFACTPSSAGARTFATRARKRP